VLYHDTFAFSYIAPIANTTSARMIRR